MTLIDGDRIITAQLYDDEYEAFTEKKMSIIDFVNTYTDEGVTTADDVIDKIRAEIAEVTSPSGFTYYDEGWNGSVRRTLKIIDKYKGESEE